ncbi:MAG: hypothetical protein MUP33_05435 [Polaromonas sp.]|nr:hypothetical protein [Polaromonas sp.]
MRLNRLEAFIALGYSFTMGSQTHADSCAPACTEPAQKRADCLIATIFCAEQAVAANSTAAGISAALLAVA